jgi:hypothetical protein
MKINKNSHETVPLPVHGKNLFGLLCTQFLQVLNSLNLREVDNALSKTKTRLVSSRNSESKYNFYVVPDRKT